MSKRRLKSTREISSQTDSQDQLGLERLIFFSDAVFAIAITLLALEIRLPETEGLLNNAELASQLSGMWHEYLAYIISFLVIGTFWMAHHRKYRFIKRCDNRLMMLNLLFLMVVAFIPFPSSIISKYPDRSATIFYATTMVLAGIFLSISWWYATYHSRLIEAELDSKQRQQQFITPLITSAIFLLSIGIAFWNENIARVSWLLILVASWYANKN
jgi:uncharacterized membrane protein